MRRMLPGACALLFLLSFAAPDAVAAQTILGRRPLHDLAGTAVDFGRDAWLTLSAPAWMSRDAWLVTGGVALVGGALFLLDDEIVDMALRNRREPLVEEFNGVGTFFEPIGLMGNTNVWWATGAVASWVGGLDAPRRMFTELLYSHWIAGAIRGGVNRVVGRSRPHDGRGSRHFELGGGTSFPSGHASTIFQVAAVLSHHVDRVPVSVALYGIATAVSWQRILDAQHWASDVWFGAAYGLAVAKLVIRLHEEEALGVTPAVLPGGEPGLRVFVRF